MTQKTTYYAYFISDGTGLTARALGHSLLTQFETLNIDTRTISYVDSVEAAKETLEKITERSKQLGTDPMIFTTLVNPEVQAVFNEAPGLIFDFQAHYLHKIEQFTGQKAAGTIGRSHGMTDVETYDHRIDAINFALATDDGLATDKYDKADIIITGVSRCGKTPTSLYLALQFGILAANYPLTEEDLQGSQLPKPLLTHRKKVFGLTIDPDRLQSIRHVRRPNSRYAHKHNCEHEIRTVETFYHDAKIPFLNTTHFSIEEIATKILNARGLTKKVL